MEESLTCEGSTTAWRSGRDLYLATKPYAVESRRQSWWYVLTTFAALTLTLLAAGLCGWLPARLCLSVLGGLLMVRAFVLYHDFLHGAILSGSWVAKVIFYAFGLSILTPPKYWRFSHNFHHANVGKPIPVEAGKFSLLTSDIGAVPLMTTDMWSQASFGERMLYRISRHPFTILLAYLTVFFYGLCVSPLISNPRKNWDTAVSLATHLAWLLLLYSVFGLQVLLFAFVLPLMVASAVGAYLFFAQHSFQGMRILPAEQWTVFRAALESTSFLKMGCVMNWFTANIGYHHVHHLNSKIPFYRLPETMAGLRELQHPTTTTLRLSDMVKCFRASLWNPQEQRLVAFPDP